MFSGKDRSVELDVSQSCDDLLDLLAPADRGCPCYDTFETSDGGWICIGSVEPKFYGELLDRLVLDLDPAKQTTPRAGLRRERVFGETFRSRTRAEWIEVLRTTDARFAPVPR